MGIIVFDNQDTLTTKPAAECRRLFNALRRMKHLIFMATSDAFPDDGTGSDKQLLRDEFDFVLENVQPKGDINVFLPAIQQAHANLVKKHFENQTQIISPNPPIKEKIVLVDDDRITTSLLGRKGIMTVWYQENMGVSALYDTIKGKLRTNTNSLHSDSPQIM